MKKGLILLQSLLLSGISVVPLFSSDNHMLINQEQPISVVDIIDLTDIESEYTLPIDMPNLYQKLLDFRHEGKTSVADLSFALTNPSDITFDWTESYPDDIEMLNYILDKKDIDLHRVTFYASIQAPYINYVIAYYFDPDQPAFETADCIGRFNWQDMDRDLWEIFWTEDVKLTYQMEFKG